MVASWVEEELATVNLQDARRDRRLKELVSDLSARPAMSLPAAVGGGHVTSVAVAKPASRNKPPWKSETQSGRLSPELSEGQR